MARVELSWREVDGGAYPDLCMTCGAPAGGSVDKTFRWMPWWRPAAAVVLGVVLVPFGMIPGIGKRLYGTTIQGLATPQEMPMRAPLCAAHRNHWQWRNVAGWGGIVGLEVIVVAGEVLFFSPRSPWLGARWLPRHGAFYAGIGAGVLAWLVGLVVMDMTAVRADRITDEGITLRGARPSSPNDSIGIARNRPTRPSRASDPALTRDTESSPSPTKEPWRMMPSPPSRT